jgi:hypothetical protein
MKKKLARALGTSTLVLAAFASPVFAGEGGGGGGGSYDAIISAVDWSDVITGIAAVAALIAAVLVVKRGTGMLLRMIGR